MSGPAPLSASTNLTSELIAFTSAHSLMAQAGSVFALCALTVILRCYARIVILKAFGSDDWTILLAFALALATFICYVLEVPQGLGRHLLVVQMNPEAYRELLKIRQVHMCCVTIGLSVVKISVGLFLLRLATKRTYRIFLWGVIVFMVAFTMASAGTLNIRLRPPPAGRGDAKCFSRDLFGRIGLFNSIVNSATDFLLALLPMPLLWRLQVNLRTKLSLIAILSLGIFACVAGIMKATYNKTILTDQRRFIHDRYSMWNFVELDVVIIAASLPALKPLFGRFLNVARGLASEKKASGYNDSKARGYLQRHQHSDETGRSRPRRATTRASVTSFGRGGLSRENVFWRNNEARDSEESILPLQNLDLKYNSVVVTTDITIERK
ncbi:hypothetical protein FB567DRAFT_546788 [Paraphoma chrysanthemicola]|uniref:Rhodopsin domain-containing protein n=1 Tax=Paraphoma chrysanthemicola TaxID=798071 RepID=A0A8K0W120_9PLEO|nr:hypothetical protein FB567DRAFT_546788 [Paraphoma chrysanthemicola]